MRRELTLDEVKSLELTLLEAFDSFCGTYHLTYYLAYGTLLGAVRHGGFIPWDDDVDVMMPRGDYERLCMIAAAPDAISGGMFLGEHRLQDGWPFAYAKVVDTGTSLDDGTRLGYPLGVNIDVFPIDGVPRTPPRRQVYAGFTRVLEGLLSLQAMAPRVGRSPLKVALLRLAGPLVHLVPRRTLVALRSRLARRYRVEPRGWSGVVSGSFLWSVPTQMLGTAGTITFEGSTVRVPTSPDTVLRAVYGDYLELPPPEARVRHHTFTAYALD